MSSYLNIYVSKTDSSDRTLLLSYVSGSDMYAYIADYAPYAYSRGDKELFYAPVNSCDIRNAYDEIKENLNRIRRQNELLERIGYKGLAAPSDNSDYDCSPRCPVDIIMENERLIDEGTMMLGQLTLLLRMLDDADDYSNVFEWNKD